MPNFSSTKTAERPQQQVHSVSEGSPELGPKSPHAHIMGLQRSVGNRTVGRMLEPGENEAKAEHFARSNSGQPLDRNTRAYMESRFSEDFSQVRVHTNLAANESARSIAARAYTVGADVVFAKRGSAPEEDPHASHERGADTAAANAVVGSRAPINVVGATAVGIAKADDEEEK